MVYSNSKPTQVYNARLISPTIHLLRSYVPFSQFPLRHSLNPLPAVQTPHHSSTPSQLTPTSTSSLPPPTLVYAPPPPSV